MCPSHLCTRRADAEASTSAGQRPSSSMRRVPLIGLGCMSVSVPRGKARAQGPSAHKRDNESTASRGRRERGAIAPLPGAERPARAAPTPAPLPVPWTPDRGREGLDAEPANSTRVLGAAVRPGLSQTLRIDTENVLLTFSRFPGASCGPRQRLPCQRGSNFRQPTEAPWAQSQSHFETEKSFLQLTR